MVAPFVFVSSSPGARRGLVSHAARRASFETYGISTKTWWFAPTLVINSNISGWETGLSTPSSTWVAATTPRTPSSPPCSGTFASSTGRTTIAAPVFFRFHDAKAGSITQVAANTVYLEHRVDGGKDWQFHLVPLFSYGEDPQGYFWNFLFGFAGATRRRELLAHPGALWIPITVRGSASSVADAGGNTSLRF